MSVQTEQYYFNARWYDPTLGRFISEDPIRDGRNWYAAMGNNPVTWIDPTGLEGVIDAYNYQQTTNETARNGGGNGVTGITRPDETPGQIAARETGDWNNWTYMTIPGWDGVDTNMPSNAPYTFNLPDTTPQGGDGGGGTNDGGGGDPGKDPPPDPPTGDRPDYGEGARTPPKTQDYPVYQQWLFPDVGPCFVRAYQAIAEQYVGIYLSVEEIYEAKKDLVSSDAVESNWYVNDRTAVINDAFARLGFPHLSAKNLGVFTNIDDIPDTADATVIGGDYGSDQHGQTGDSRGNITFDPWQGGLVTTNKSYRAFSITDTTPTTTRRR